ncbi:MAG: hypothetical protein J2P21_10425 [Chloracidobacterium sp.]|nr:hypothetical protein [Chloracidobacterium sp.]
MEKPKHLAKSAGDYDDLGESQKALDFYNKALPLFRKAGDSSEIARKLNNIGGLFDSLGEG